MPQFRRGYFIAAIGLLGIEILIALFVQDNFFRPYGGDFIIVMFLYCLLRSFFRLSVQKSLLLVLLIAYTIEFSQYLNLVTVLGLENNNVANIVLGNYFDWEDMFIYSLSAFTIFVIEKLKTVNGRNSFDFSSKSIKE